MTDGVFGTPIDTQTLEGMPQYRNKIIRRSDLAQVARDLMNAEGKDTNCRQYVENLRDEYGYGVKTLCTIYNATGDDLTFVMAHNWHGHIGSRPYPLVIMNGQWGAFLHVHPTAEAHGSIAAVVYRGFNNDGVKMNWLLSWSNPWIGANRVYTLIREDGHFKNGDLWEALYEKVDNASMDSNEEYNGCTSKTIIGTDTTTSYTAILTLTASPDLPDRPKPPLIS